MEKGFSVEEKRKFMFQKHLKNHAFEYVLDFIGPIVLTIVLLYICEAQNYWCGIIIACVYSVLKTIYNIVHFKKEYIDVDIK